MQRRQAQRTLGGWSRTILPTGAYGRECPRGHSGPMAQRPRRALPEYRHRHRIQYGGVSCLSGSGAM